MVLAPRGPWGGTLMALRLAVDNMTQLPDGGPLSYTLHVKGAVEIGRAQYLDWVLPDPAKVVSNKHCEIRWADGAYWLSDISTNGTFLNGSEDRLQGKARLKTGDRIAIGQYIIAVSIDDVEAPGQRSGGLPKAVGLGDLWNDAAAAPPIDAKLLRPQGKDSRPNDFINRVADLPWIDPAPPSPAPKTPAVPTGGEDDWLPRTTPSPTPTPPDAQGWAERGERLQPVPPVPVPIEKAAAIAMPLHDEAPSRPAPVAALPDPPPLPGPVARVEAEGAAVSGNEGAAVMARLARGLGLPETIFADRDAGTVAEEIGQLVQMVTVHLKALLEDRQQAKRALKVSNHTTIAAFENNALKFQPTAQHALAVMFGPPSEHYLDARRSLEEAFKDLAEHQLLTFSAMQRAVQVLEKELDPAAIEGSLEHEKGLAAIVGRSHARAWDAYVHRWADRTKYQGDGLHGAFMRDFTKCYDDLAKGNK